MSSRHPANQRLLQSKLWQPSGLLALRDPLILRATQHSAGGRSVLMVASRGSEELLHLVLRVLDGSLFKQVKISEKEQQDGQCGQSEVNRGRWEE